MYPQISCPALMMVALTKAALGVNESSKFCDEQFGFSD
jgi:hypothetical protein